MRHPWRERLTNLFATLFVLGIWIFTAWSAKKLGWVESEDHFFTLLVAANLAFHLHKVKP